MTHTQSLPMYRQGRTKDKLKVRSRQRLNNCLLPLQDCHHPPSKRAQGVPTSASSREISSNLVSRGSLWMLGKAEMVMRLAGTRTEAEGAVAGTGVLSHGAYILLLQHLQGRILPFGHYTYGLPELPKLRVCQI